jgi:hypothetical protein
MSDTPKIQHALLGAMRDICKIGIGKTSQANTGAANYRFRGIDAAMNEMSPILVNNGITVTPKYSDLNIQERAKDGGKFTRFVTIKGAFTFAADDGSSVTAEAYGEAMDSGDKATIKAQSVAFRTVLFQQFIVPVMAMDTELDGSEDDGPSELDEWRETALQGTAALKARYEASPPLDAFWKANAHSLKLAAQKADQEQREAAK